MNKKTIENIDVKGKRVFVRCDFNVPLSDDGKITDDNRIVAALPTIKYLMKHDAKVILCSHLGRPKNGFNEKYSMKPVAARLNELVKGKVILAADVIGQDAKLKASELKNGQALLLENVRFHPEEEKNDPEFAKQLSSFADIYVNDAFGAAHRAHASTAGIAKFCGVNAAGFLMEKELNVLGKAMDNPERPFLAILGGAKVSDKIGVIENLLKKVDSIIIGGAMAFTFIAARGGRTGISKTEPDKFDIANSILESAENAGVKIYLPVDCVAAREFSPDSFGKTFPSDNIQDDFMGLDIGLESCRLFTKVVSEAQTVFWNGPMGVFEFDKFAQGTKCIAEAMAANKRAVTIVGGGDSAAAVEKFGYKDKVTHVSTGGGASLEFIEGRAMPGVECLDNN